MLEFWIKSDYDVRVTESPTDEVFLETDEGFSDIFLMGVSLMALGKVYTLPLFRDGVRWQQQCVSSCSNIWLHMIFEVNRSINSRAFVLLSLVVKFKLLTWIKSCEYMLFSLYEYNSLTTLFKKNLHEIGASIYWPSHREPPSSFTKFIGLPCAIFTFSMLSPSLNDLHLAPLIKSCHLTRMILWINNSVKLFLVERNTKF